jgi:hypothetical protein
MFLASSVEVLTKCSVIWNVESMILRRDWSLPTAGSACWVQILDAPIDRRLLEKEAVL